jgi:hypothetical protein
MKTFWLTLAPLGLVFGSDSNPPNAGADEQQPAPNSGQAASDADNVAIPGYKELVKDYQNPSRSSSLVIAQDSNGKPKIMLAPILKVKKRMCYTNEGEGFETWSTLRLVSTVPGLTAGSIKIGEDKAETTFIHLLPESEFIHVPRGAFQRISNIVGLSGDKVMKTPWRFSRDKLKDLPTIDLQFAESNALFTLTPEAYTRCAKDGDECVLLVKLGSLEKRDFWFLGKPFFDYTVAVFSIGNYKDAFVHVCYPILAKGLRESWPVKIIKSDNKVGMPWTANDYILMVLIVLFVLGCIYFIFRNRLTCCRRRPRPQAAQSVEEGDNQPLLNDSNQPASS